MSEPDENEEPLVVSTDDRRAAHAALDRFFHACDREGNDAFSVGRSGYIGRIKLCAFVRDEGIALRIEHSFTRDL